MDGFGPFFAVARHQVSPTPPWRPMSELIDDPDALTARVHKVRSALMGNGEPEIRVAASVAHLGLVARLIAPMNWRELPGAPPAGTEVCRLAEVPSDNALERRFGAAEPRFALIVLRHADGVVGYLNRCPHAGIKQGEIECRAK